MCVCVSSPGISVNRQPHERPRVSGQIAAKGHEPGHVSVDRRRRVQLVKRAFSSRRTTVASRSRKVRRALRLFSRRMTIAVVRVPDRKENKRVGSEQSWSKEGTVRHRQSKEANIVWSHHEETRDLPGEIDNARNNARCTQARKATHGLGGQHQDVDRPLHGRRVNQNDIGQG